MCVLLLVCAVVTSIWPCGPMQPCATSSTNQPYFLSAIKYIHSFFFFIFLAFFFLFSPWVSFFCWSFIIQKTLLGRKKTGWSLSLSLSLKMSSINSNTKASWILGSGTAVQNCSSSVLLLIIVPCVYWAGSMVVCGNATILKQFVTVQVAVCWVGCWSAFGPQRECVWCFIMCLNTFLIAYQHARWVIYVTTWL